MWRERKRALDAFVLRRALNQQNRFARFCCLYWKCACSSCVRSLAGLAGWLVLLELCDLFEFARLRFAFLPFARALASLQNILVSHWDDMWWLLSGINDSSSSSVRPEHGLFECSGWKSRDSPDFYSVIELQAALHSAAVIHRHFVWWKAPPPQAMLIRVTVRIVYGIQWLWTVMNIELIPLS